MEEKKQQYSFVVETGLVCELFDSIEDVIQYAQSSWDNKDGNPFDDCTEYSGRINICTAIQIIPSEMAPSLDHVAYDMTDIFYNEYPIDDDADVSILHREEAEKAWEEFCNKYFELPCTIIGEKTLGVYNLIERKWQERYDQK